MKLLTASLMVLLAGSVSLGQPSPKPPVKGPPKVVVPASGVSIRVSGVVTLRPQNVERAIGAGAMFDDESVRVSAAVSFAAMEERNGFENEFRRIAVQGQDAEGRWVDVHSFVTELDTALPAPGKKPVVQPKPTLPVDTRPELEAPVRESRPEIPQKPGSKPRPKLEMPERTTVVPGRSFETPELKLPAGTRAIRARALRADGSAVESAAVAVEVRSAPQVLTLLAMGGSCFDPDANTNHKNLSEAGITRDKAACEARGVNATFIGDLTQMSNVNCNNPCADCTNFFEHLALRIMNNRNLANVFESINNDGDRFCDRRENGAGVRNRIIFGKWRNTEEEPVCSTTIKFNTIIDEFVQGGGKSVILIGQSQGGAKLAGMIRDHWRWGNDLTVELIALWDATSFDTPNGFDTGHFGITSMGVRTVGTRPRKVLNFCQYSNPVPFQNGSPLDPSEPHADLEEHDLDGLFSHNGIARSQFVHHRTAEVVQEALQAARDRARN